MAALSNVDPSAEDYMAQYCWMSSRNRKHKTGFTEQLVTACKYANLLPSRRLHEQVPVHLHAYNYS